MKRLLLVLASAALLYTSCNVVTVSAQPRHPHRPHNSYHRPQPPHRGARVAITQHASHLKAVEDPRTGLYGYLNSFGTWAIAPTFRNAKSFNDELGLAVVQIQNGMWGAINIRGQVAIQFNFTSQYDVDSAIRSILKGRLRGIDLWETYDATTDLWGYLDYYGNWHLPPQFRYAKSMSSRGVAVVQFKSGMWGAITRNGEIVVKPNFTSQYDVDSAIRNLRLY